MSKIYGNLVVRLAHRHKCKPVCQPNGSLHIEGTEHRLRKLLVAFARWQYFPSLWLPRRNEDKLPGWVSHICVHPSIATRAGAKLPRNHAVRKNPDNLMLFKEAVRIQQEDAFRLDNMEAVTYMYHFAADYRLPAEGISKMMTLARIYPGGV